MDYFEFSACGINADRMVVFQVNALKYLLKREWSMGNGQCPDCCGVPASWHGHPLYLTTKGIGHKKACKLALAIKDAGGKPLMIGQFKSDISWESAITADGFLTTQLKGSDPEAKARNDKFNADFNARIDRIFYEGLMGKN